MLNTFEIFFIHFIKKKVNNYLKPKTFYFKINDSLWFTYTNIKAAIGDNKLQSKIFVPVTANLFNENKCHVETEHIILSAFINIRWFIICDHSNNNNYNKTKIFGWNQSKIFIFTMYKNVNNPMWIKLCWIIKTHVVLCMYVSITVFFFFFMALNCVLYTYF